MKWVLISLIIAFVLFVLDRLMLWFEAKGWLYYRHNQPKSGGFGNALMDLQKHLQPQTRHQIEAKETRKKQNIADDLSNTKNQTAK